MSAATQTPHFEKGHSVQVPPFEKGHSVQVPPFEKGGLGGIKLLTDHIDIWSDADTEKKSGRGRSSGNAASVYGIRKLRELILELAVRGKLVPQDANDEPASALLKGIQAEKAKLIAEGKIKNEKPLPLITDDEKPFALPQGWAWVRLGYLVNIYTGKLDANAASKNGKYPFFTCSQTPSKIDTYSFDTAAVLLAGNGDFNVKYYQGKFDAYQRTYVIEPVNFGLKFCFLLVLAQIEIITKNNRGSAIPYLKIGDLTSPVFALPPLAEQHRIVAKVDELMALCDQLETRHNNAAEAHEKLVSHLLATLTQSQNAADFSANWQRIAAHFDTLFTTEASIAALKQTLLQLAVMGKLVPQDPNDEPASALLKRIQAEKAKLIAEGKLKQEKLLPPIAEDERPFELPRRWEWVRTIDCSVLITDGEHATPQRTPGGLIPLVTAKNVRDGYMDYDDTDFVEVAVAEKCWKRCKPDKGDIMMVSVGATLGRLTVIGEQKDMVIVRSVTLIRPCLTNADYFALALKSPLIQQTIWGNIKQMAQPGIYLAQSSSMPIPLPPLAEQHRIVAKVEELMALCDQLKSRLTLANQLQQKLADVVVEQAIA